jgi:hypothetical protein
VELSRWVDGVDGQRVRLAEEYWGRGESETLAITAGARAISGGAQLGPK